MSHENLIRTDYSNDTLNIFLDMRNDERAIKHLTDLQNHHPASFIHSYNVAMFCLDLARVNGMSDEQVRNVTVAGLLHDVGKRIVPVNILAKPEELDETEMSIVEEHSRRAFKVLEELGEDTVKKIVVGHHEYQPVPYPRKSKPYDVLPKDIEERRVYNPNIIKLTELVAIADIYESLVSIRPYKPAITERNSLEYAIRTQFKGSPELLETVIETYVLK